MEWKAGSEHIKGLILNAGSTDEKRISNFALAGTPFSAEQRKSFIEDNDETDVELSEVTVVADAETAETTEAQPVSDSEEVKNPVSKAD